MKKATLNLSSPNLLVKIHEAALALAMPELQFVISPENGLVINRLDSSKAAHLRIEIPPSDFSEYKVPEERIICVDMESLGLVVKRIKRLKDQPIDISIIDNEMLIANVGNPKREFSLSLLSPAEDSKELNLDLPTLIVVDAKEMSEQVKDLSGIAAHAIVEVIDGLLTIHGEGDKGKVSVQTSLTELDLVKSHEGPNAKAMYSMQYLEQVFAFLSQFDVIALRFTDNKPLTLTTIIGDGAIRILIAPRVERR
jgi:DNA polymerase III sliding clamp (beta) subunit (PCNA family)